MPRGSRTSGRTLAVAAGVGLLMVLVAFLAGSVREAPAADRLIQVDRRTVAVAMRQVLFIVYLAVLVHAFYLWLTRDPGARRKGTRGRPGIGVLLGALLIMLVVMLTLGDRFPQAGESSPSTFPTVTGIADPQVVSPTSRAPGGQSGLGWLWLLLGGMAMTALVVISARRRPQNGHPTPDVPVAEAISVAVGRRPSRTPRDRVFAAYRRVESAAAARGLERLSHETVGSHLRRLFDGPPAAEALRVLYNAARFSPRVISADEANEAESAAQEIEGSLR